MCKGFTETARIYTLKRKQFSIISGHTAHIGVERNSALKYLGHRCIFGKKYYSDDETIVIIGDVCSRMSPFSDSTYFTLDD